jgi:hypothetical protein
MRGRCVGSAAAESPQLANPGLVILVQGVMRVGWRMRAGGRGPRSPQEYAANHAQTGQLRNAGGGPDLASKPVVTCLLPTQWCMYAGRACTKTMTTPQILVVRGVREKYDRLESRGRSGQCFDAHRSRSEADIACIAVSGSVCGSTARVVLERVRCAHFEIMAALSRLPEDCSILLNCLYIIN